jgi:fructosamine-3-kinase
VDRTLADTLAATLGSEVVATTRVHGGDTAAAYRVDLADGRRVFAKTHAAPPAHFFSTEAAGLRWLREPGALRVPEVMVVRDEAPALLVLEWIDEGSLTGTTDAAFGRALAELHDAGAPCFGRADRRTTGSLALPNEPCTSWAEHYARNRLVPLARLARDRSALPDAGVVALERLADDLTRFDDGTPPSRLHGDLWAGNRMIDRAGTSWIVDPAAQGGHREFDLAMMRLFGGFSESCFAAYHELRPLRDGWQQRVALHQIAPLVVHAIKFGGGYVRSAMAAIAATTG